MERRYHINKWASSNPKLYPVLKERAKQMRVAMTEAEKKVWEIVRAERLGTKFRRQQPIGEYIADFLCVQYKLVIEVDGDVHDNSKQMAHDRERDRWMEKNGYKVLRFRNDEVLMDSDSVRERILKERS